MGLDYLESRVGDGQGLFVRWWGGMEFWRRVELLAPRMGSRGGGVKGWIPVKTY